MLLSAVVALLPVVGSQSGLTMRQVWSRTMPKHARVSVSPDGQLVIGDCLIDRGTGKEVSKVEAVGASKQNYGETATGEAVQIDSQAYRFVWDGTRSRIALAEASGNLVELAAASDEMLSRLTIREAIPGPYRFRGLPERGWFIVSGDKYSDNRDWTVEAMVLTGPLRYAPLNFIRFYDVSRDGLALGVSLPEGAKYSQLADMRLTPNAPLSCGETANGKIRWRRGGYNWGRWMDGFVVACSDRNDYSILDSRGRTRIEKVSQLNGIPKSDIAVAGAYLVVSRREWKGNRATAQAYVLGISQLKAAAASKRSKI